MDALPSLVALDDGFAAWPVVELRSAGFSRAVLEPLVARDVAARAHDVARERQRLDEARRALVAACLDRRRATDDEVSRAALARVKRAAERGHPLVDVEEALQPLADALTAARAARALAEDGLSQMLALHRTRAARALIDRARDERFVRAISWQNLGAVDGTLRNLARAKPEDVRTRDLALAYAYLARYATKNDTVAFVGPVGWAQIVDDAFDVHVAPGDALLRRFDVHFEPWAIAALADGLAARVKRHVVPRLSPRVRVDGEWMIGPATRRLDARVALTELEREVLARVDGVTPLAALVDDARLWPIAEDLIARRVVWARLPVTTTTEPERALDEALLAFPDDDDVRAARRALGELVDAKDAVSRAADDAVALRSALTKLDLVFARVSGAKARRHAGKMYASRTLLYANGCRDVDVALGRTLTEKLARPLALLSRLCRTFTVDVARRFLVVLDGIYARLAAQTRDPRVPLVLVYERLVAIFKDPPPDFLRAARAANEARVCGVFGPLDEGAREVRLSTTELAPRLVAHCPERAPGYPGARHHSPDVLLRRRGDGHVDVVLGEIHAGTNTLSVQQAVDQSDDPALLRALFRRDLAAPLFAEVQHEDFGLCAHDMLLDDDDVHLDTGSRFDSWLGAHRTIPLSALLLEREDGFLRVVDDEGYPVGDAMQIFERMLRLNATTEFHLPVTSPHQPRVWLDDVVVQRETWTLTKDALAPVVLAEGAHRLVEVARLRERLGLPRQLFLRVPQEKKPLFVDLESPLSVDVFCRHAERAATLVLSEMLPSLDEAVLVDRDGERYVSELRMVVVDPAPWQPIPVPREVEP